MFRKTAEKRNYHSRKVCLIGRNLSVKLPTQIRDSVLALVVMLNYHTDGEENPLFN